MEIPYDLSASRETTGLRCTLHFRLCRVEFSRDAEDFRRKNQNLTATAVRPLVRCGDPIPA